MDNELNLQVFCKNMYALRKKNNLTQQQMARILGISIKSLRSVEKGSVPPRMKISVVYRIYNTFHLLPSELFKP